MIYVLLMILRLECLVIKINWKTYRHIQHLIHIFQTLILYTQRHYKRSNAKQFHQLLFESIQKNTSISLLRLGNVQFKTKLFLSCVVYRRFEINWKHFCINIIIDNVETKNQKWKKKKENYRHWIRWKCVCVRCINNEK